MLVVAVTGPVGSGKSTAVEAFAHAVGADARVDGFVAVGGARDEAGRGAASYTLRMLRDGRELLFARRAPVGYDFDEATLRDLAEWAESLPQNLDVVVLDEFGRWEAEGGGHWPLWAKVMATRPKLAVVVVKESVLAQIEERMGRKFDLVLDTRQGNVADRLLEIAAQRPDWERVGKFGAGAGALEMTVGAALHTVRFPLTGIAMSSAQAGVLTVAGDGLIRKPRVVWVAFIASGLKALSPSGKRLGPMLAIAMQGLLFTGATTIAGWNAFGVFLGGALMGAWASSQGFFVQYLMLGGALEKAYNEAVKWVASHLDLHLPGLLALVGVVVSINAALAGFAALALWRRRAKMRARLERWMERHRAPMAMARRKGFWLASLFLPTSLVAGILVSTGTPWADVAVIFGRAIGVALLLFAVIQRWNPAKFLGLLRRRGHWGPAYAMDSAMESKRET